MECDYVILDSSIRLIKYIEIYIQIRTFIISVTICIYYDSTSEYLCVGCNIHILVKNVLFSIMFSRLNQN